MSKDGDENAMEAGALILGDQGKDFKNRSLNIGILFFFFVAEEYAVWMNWSNFLFYFDAKYSLSDSFL